jgi:AraC family transcriptional regulator
MEIREGTLAAQPGAGILHVGRFDTLGADFDRLGGWMAGHMADLRGAPRCVYLDDPQQTPADELRTWVVVPVSDSLVLTDDDLPVVPCPQDGGRYLVGMHQGSYDGLAAAWSQFMAAVASSGSATDGSRPCLEVYLSDPRTTPEDQYLTELYWPIT